MKGLSENLDDLGASPAVRAFVHDLDRARNVESGRRSNYVSLRPSLDGAIAVYIHKDNIKIALDPARASAVQRDVPGVTLHMTTPATTYVRVGEDGMDDPLVLALATEAVDWRAAGPKMTAADGRSGRSDRPMDVCVTCRETVAVNGSCSCD